MTAWERARRLSLGVEIAAAFATGAASFVLAAVAFASIDSGAILGVLGVAYVIAVVLVARSVSIAFAVPVALAGLLAFDWYILPPTHPLEIPDSANLVDVIVYLGVAVLLGELAAQAGRRAEAAEHARGRIADEQAALRRVATLVARGAPAYELFTAVAAEAGVLLDVDGVRIARYENHAELAHVAEWSKPGHEPPPYDRAGLEGTSVSGEVLRTGRATRIDAYEEIPVRAPFARGVAARSVVGAPVLVEGRRWGVMIVWSGSEPLPAGTEERVSEFAGLVATAIANTQARADLAASRARVLAAADEERRRVVRDLHDGAQQRLVHTMLTLEMADRALAAHSDEAPALVKEAVQQARQAMAELRELAHGILPTVLTHGGLRAGVDALASRMPIPVQMDVPADRLPGTVEATAYFVVAEALTNVAKHAAADRAEVVARIGASTLKVEVRDDGSGGARVGGNGLVGLADRLAALDGRLEIDSPRGHGTRVTAAIPLR